MSNELVNPLQAIVRKAAQSLPATTGRTAAQQVRIDRRAGEVVILADVSASMSAPSTPGKRKIDVLREAVAAAKQRSPCRLIAFSGEAREVEQIPEPDSHTDLANGLRAAQAHDPGMALVISDGQPDHAAAALAVARAFRGAIDVLYIGPEDDLGAIEFMRVLAAAGGGDVTINDVGTAAGAQRLLGCIAGLLPAPRP